MKKYDYLTINYYYLTPYYSVIYKNNNVIISNILFKKGVMFNYQDSEIEDVVKFFLKGNSYEDICQFLVKIGNQKVNVEDIFSELLRNGVLE